MGLRISGALGPLSEVEAGVPAIRGPDGEGEEGRGLAMGAQGGGARRRRGGKEKLTQSRSENRRPDAYHLCVFGGDPGMFCAVNLLGSL